MKPEHHPDCVLKESKHPNHICRRTEYFTGWPKRLPTVPEAARAVVKRHFPSESNHWDECIDPEMKALHEALEREQG